MLIVRIDAPQLFVRTHSLLVGSQLMKEEFIELVGKGKLFFSIYAVLKLRH
jgi:hypothetical protein